MMEREPVITASGLSIGYRNGKKEVTVQQHLDFSLHAGELTCLLGSNGSGKSTLLRTLAAAQPPLGGDLRILGKPLSAYGEKERSRTIGVVLTDKTFAGGLTVYELVGLGRQPHTGFFGRLGRDDRRIIDEALDNVGIAHKAHCYTAELSDGERQKAMIAKALVQECPLILLDEPTAFLDVVSRIEIMNLLHRLATEQDKAILMSTHDIEQALVLADRLWLMSKTDGMSCGVTEDIVLARKMAGLFRNKDICFDYDLGAYCPMPDGQTPIGVASQDKTLLHWTVNALNRHGFRCLPADAVPDRCLTAVSANELRLVCNGVEAVLTSFDALLCAIKSVQTADGE